MTKSTKVNRRVFIAAKRVRTVDFSGLVEDDIKVLLFANSSQKNQSFKLQI